MSNALLIISGLFGLIAYFEIIRIGFRDKTFGVPVAALLTNISWEFYYSFVYPHTNIQVYINILWFLFDLIILFQLLKYWRTEYKDISTPVFYISFLIAQIMAFLLIVIIEKEFGSWGLYTGFGDNFMMSVLFIVMLYRRKSLRGQSIYIAFYKMIMTLAASIWTFRYDSDGQTSMLLQFFFVSIFILDLIYLILVYLQSKKLLFPDKETALA